MARGLVEMEVLITEKMKYPENHTQLEKYA